MPVRGSGDGRGEPTARSDNGRRALWRMMMTNLKTALDNLSDRALQLNERTDAVNDLIERVEQRLAEMKVGTSVPRRR